MSAFSNLLSISHVCLLLKKKKIILFLAVLGLCCCTEFFFSSSGKQGLLSGFGAQISLAMEHRLQNMWTRGLLLLGSRAQPQ